MGTHYFSSPGLHMGIEYTHTQAQTANLNFSSWHIKGWLFVQFLLKVITWAWALERSTTTFVILSLLSITCYESKQSFTVICDQANTFLKGDSRKDTENKYTRYFKIKLHDKFGLKNGCKAWNQFDAVLYENSCSSLPRSWSPGGLGGWTRGEC